MERKTVIATAKRVSHLSEAYKILTDNIKLMNEDEKKALSENYQQLDKAFQDCMNSELKYYSL